MPLTPAEKQARYRARKKELAPPVPGSESIVERALEKGLDLSDPAFVEVSVGARDVPIPEPPEDPPELQARPSRAGRQPKISEDDYVQLMLSEPYIIDRVRAERYARWRYQGVLAGKVASL